MKAEIVSIGTEILLGEITDTNAQYMASRLPMLGIDLYWVSQVGDNRARIIEVLQRAWNRSDIILLTGGLGPTADDVTREAIAGMFGEELTVHPDLEKNLRARFEGMGREMPLSNLKQATLIPSAQSIPNPAGTAPGWWIERDGRILVTMPGPPRELDVVWRETVQPRLEKRTESVLVARIFKTFGFSEGALGEMVNDLLEAANPTLGIYAKADGIHLRLAAKAKNREEALALMAESEKRIHAIAGEHIWGIDDDTLDKIIGKLMEKKGLTMGVMEGCSGVNLSTIFNKPECAHFFRGGLMVTSDGAKTSVGLKSGLTEYERAGEMAAKARDFFNADIGVSTVVAEETTQDAQFGTLYAGIADRKETRVITLPRRPQHINAAVLFSLREFLLSAV